MEFISQNAHLRQYYLCIMDNKFLMSLNQYKVAKWKRCNSELTKLLSKTCFSDPPEKGIELNNEKKNPFF